MSKVHHSCLRCLQAVWLPDQRESGFRPATHGQGEICPECVAALDFLEDLEGWEITMPPATGNYAARRTKDGTRIVCKSPGQLMAAIEFRRYMEQAELLSN